MTARITRHDDAPEYSPHNHVGVGAFRLQGHEAGPTERFWVGESSYPPGSAAETSPTSQETVYVVLDGTLKLTADDAEHTLEAGDSVHMTAGTVRRLDNVSSADARILVIVALPLPEPVEP